MTDPNSQKRKPHKCPQCGRLTLYSLENEFRPFCSERCKLTDLGGWASEAYRVPVNQMWSDDSDDVNGSDNSDEGS